MKVSYEYDQDPRYGWAAIDIGQDKEALIVIHNEGEGSRGFTFKNGEMIPTCICSAWSESECCCSGVEW